MLIIALFYALVSVTAYVAYAIDKKAAIKRRQRVSEKTLHLLSLAGGWPGAWFAQRYLRHKTQKTAFRVVFGITVALNLAGLWLLATYF